MRLWQMKTIDIFQRIRLNTCLFVLIFGGTDRGGKQLKQNSRCHNLRDIL